jgi:hypothetical protein
MQLFAAAKAGLVLILSLALSWTVSVAFTRIVTVLPPINKIIFVLRARA